VWVQARRDLGDKVLADRLKGCRHALWKNPGHLTRRQRGRLAWASRCQIPAIVELARRIRRHGQAIEEAMRSGTSNALIEYDEHQDPGADSGRARAPPSRGPDRDGSARRRRVPPRAVKDARARCPPSTPPRSRRRQRRAPDVNAQGGWRHQQGDEGPHRRCVADEAPSPSPPLPGASPRGPSGAALLARHPTAASCQGEDRKILSQPGDI